ncbi:head GIN domain-containing protein [Flavobacterium rhizosphaerae]|uniref:Head GIN domain-containing protein n=1 Tax=Flavobacterium rhizosphaerae TaxID=3163298 RepID=A0ABW8YT99_9FLAO
MKQLVALAAGIFFTLSARAQNAQELKNEVITASSHTIKEQRQTEAYNALDITGPFEVTITRHNSNQITINGPENITPLVLSEVKEGTLYISLQKNLTIEPGRHNKISIEIPYKEFTTIALNGSGSIASGKTFKNDIVFKLNGGGNMDFYLYANSTQAKVYGSGSITLRGYCKHTSLDLTGSGVIDTKRLETRTVEAYLTGSGKLNVMSNDKITGRINGTGTIAFTGEPENQDLKCIGSGTFEVF